MATTQEDVSNFTIYAYQQTAAGHQDLTIDELFDQWRAENPSDEQFAQNDAAVHASIQDYLNGERGSLAGEHSAKLRRDLWPS